MLCSSEFRVSWTLFLRVGTFSHSLRQSFIYFSVVPFLSSKDGMRVCDIRWDWSPLRLIVPTPESLKRWKWSWLVAKSCLFGFYLGWNLWSMLRIPGSEAESQWSNLSSLYGASGESNYGPLQKRMASVAESIVIETWYSYAANSIRSSLVIIDFFILFLNLSNLWATYS